MKIGGIPPIFLYGRYLSYYFMIYLLSLIIALNVSVLHGQSDEYDYYFEGQYNLLEQNYEDAVLNFTKALAQDSTSFEIYSALEESYYYLERFEEVEKLLEKAFVQFPDSQNVALYLIDIYIHNEKLDKINSLSNIISSRFSDDVKFLAKIAVIQEDNKNVEGLFLTVSRMYLLTEDVELLLAMLSVPSETSQHIISNLKWILSCRPTDISVMYILSQVYAYEGKLGLAYRQIQKTLKVKPDYYDALLLKSQLLVEKGNTPDALSILLPIYIKNDYSLLLTEILIDIYSVTSDNEIFEQVITSGLSKFPDEHTLYTSYIWFLITQERKIELRKVIDLAIEKFPEIPIYYHYSAYNYMIDGFVDEAIEHFRKLLALYDDNESAITLAMLLNETYQYSEADSIFNLLIEKDSSNANILNNFAYFLSCREDASLESLNIALTLSQKSVKLEPGNPLFLDTLGWIYYQLGNINQALLFIDKSNKLEADNPEVITHLGDVVKAIGYHERAQIFYQKAFELDSLQIGLKYKIENENEK
jgi:tetratricopeptide (TPR) repeat protein